MNRRAGRRRVVVVAVAAALFVATAALLLRVVGAAMGLTALRAMLAPGDPDLALAYPLNNASDLGSTEAVVSVVLVAVLVLWPRRLLFALAVIWSLVVLVTLALVLRPAEPFGLIWSARPLVPYQLLDQALVLGCVLWLAASVGGGVITPFGWDWLSPPPEHIPFPAVTAPHRG